MAEEQRDQIAGRHHQQHAGDGQQQQHAELGRQQLGAGEAVERHDEHQRGAGEHEQLGEAAEGVD